MRKSCKKILVYENWSDQPVLIGKLYLEEEGTKPAFEYDEKWLMESDMSFVIDPDLHLYKERRYVQLDKKIFNIFLDSCPDGWGKSLLDCKEHILAKKENRKLKELNEIDYLLNVPDETRMGAVRFSQSKRGSYLLSDKEHSALSWDGLSEFESYSTAFEQDPGSLDEAVLCRLIKYGSALGGKRPKAAVRAEDGSLWIAKFPSVNDKWNAGAWEMTVHDLAYMCGINVPEACIESLSEHGSIYLVKRFDRYGNKRIHFASARVLLEKKADIKADKNSYLDIASFIKSNGVFPKKNLAELWKRIVFKLLVSDNDDMDDHAFILTEKGWELSPAFDINPTVYDSKVSIKIDKDSDAFNLDTAVKTACYYDLEEDEAVMIINSMKKTVADNWRKTAEKYGIDKEQIEFMRPAFRLSEC